MQITVTCKIREQRYNCKILAITLEHINLLTIAGIQCPSDSPGSVNLFVHNNVMNPQPAV
jgi:hypothetical protein